MNRIAVISSWAWIKVANNYGALLQYYALQQYLTRKNNYVFWIKWEFYKRWNGPPGAERQKGGLYVDIKRTEKNRESC